MLTVGNGKCDSGVSSGLSFSVESDKEPLQYGSQNLFVVPRHSKQAGVVETSRPVCVELGASVVAPCVSVPIGEEPAVFSVPDIVENQGSVAIEPAAGNEEEHLSNDPEVVADERNVSVNEASQQNIVDEATSEDAVEQESMGEDHDLDQGERLEASEGSEALNLCFLVHTVTQATAYRVCSLRLSAPEDLV
ncbi:hypothetical protein V6N13_071295 [Hibiscus sabdariffa]